jgi:hypothetical protein
VQVPPEIMELLNDDTSSDMSAKEIMRQWEQRGKNPLSAPTAAASPRNPGPAASKKDQRNAPQITPADSNPQPYAGEASVRHVGPGGHAMTPSNAHNSPSQQHDMGTPNPQFGRNPQDSTESHRTASPHRHSYRSPAYQKQTQIGTAGAG